MIKANKPVFVIGFPRSGTTVLSEAIAAHESFGWFSNYYNLMPNFPELSVINRMLDIPNIGWRLRGKKKQNNNFISAIRKLLPYSVEAYSVWESCCGEKFLYDYLLDHIADEYEKRKINNVILKVLKFQKKNRFIAKITGPPRIGYLKSIFPDAIFIHTIRDPKAVVSSLMKVDFWKDRDGMKRPWWHNGLSKGCIDEWENSGWDPIALSAIQWREIIKIAWAEKEKIGRDDYFEVKYENFVNNPQNTLKQIMKQLGLEYSVNIDRYVATHGKPKNMNYKFRQNLKPSESKTVMQVTGVVANKLGYF
jgi:hypothetical protein